jgi:hypothetical protein
VRFYDTYIFLKKINILILCIIIVFKLQVSYQQNLKIMAKTHQDGFSNSFDFVFRISGFISFNMFHTWVGKKK